MNTSMEEIPNLWPESDETTIGDSSGTVYTKANNITIQTDTVPSILPKLLPDDTKKKKNKEQNLTNVVPRGSTDEECFMFASIFVNLCDMFKRKHVMMDINMKNMVIPEGGEELEREGKEEEDLKNTESKNISSINSLDVTITVDGEEETTA